MNPTASGREITLQTRRPSVFNMVIPWAIIIPSGALLLAALLFLWKEQKELNQATLQTGKGFEEILNGKLDKYHEQEKHELNRFKDDVNKQISKLSDLEKSVNC